MPQGVQTMTALLPDSPIFIYFALFLPVGLIAIALISKGFEVRAASKWPSVSGVVVQAETQVLLVRQMFIRSGRRTRRRRPIGYRFVERTFPNIVYEYEVAGETYTNNRVTIGEDPGDFRVAETVARYPVGKRVTVYYNPARRGEAVLERDLPGSWRGAAWFVAVSAALIFGSIIGFNKLTQLASNHVANAPLTVVISAFGTIIALVALGIQRQARQARFWPVAQAVIRTSGLEQLERMESNVERPPIRLRLRIGYSYRFKGKEHDGTLATVTLEAKSMSDRALQPWMERYPNGKFLAVYVNPENPSQSVLEPRARGIWVMWVIAAVLFALAAFVATRG